MSKPTHRNCVLFLPDDRRAYFGERAPTVLKLALENRVSLNHSCGGMGSCGTCRIFIESDISELPPRNAVEAEIAEDRGFTDRERLACQLRAQSGLMVRVPNCSPEDESCQE